MTNEYSTNVVERTVYLLSCGIAPERAPELAAESVSARLAADALAARLNAARTPTYKHTKKGYKVDGDRRKYEAYVHDMHGRCYVHVAEIGNWGERNGLGHFHVIHNGKIIPHGAYLPKL